jgi:AP-1 complex subunit beta-1
MQTQLQILTAVVKLFLKRPQAAQGLVQKVLNAATAESDNPDIRDRAYVYWRLLSNTSDQNAPKNIVLSEKPPITTTIQSLPPQLLDRLLSELSTLASVYHKPPEQFIGQGRFGADAVQQAAIEEQMQNAKENPLAAAAAAAAVHGKAPEATNNLENLLDIDFDGAAPASAMEKPTNGLSGLEGLAGTPQRVASPTVGQPAPANNMDDLLGVFGNGGLSAGPSSSGGFGGMSDSDILNGFASMDMGSSQPPPAKQQLANASSNSASEDLLSL